MLYNGNGEYQLICIMLVKQKLVMRVSTVEPGDDQVEVIFQRAKKEIGVEGMGKLNQTFLSRNLTVREKSIVTEDINTVGGQINTYYS